jgi:sarcosine oxidase
VDGVDVEFVVVGAGALGLSAARSLGRRGHEVVVCERATVGHGASGSKGSARIFRLGYDDPGYVRLALVAQRLWAELEAEWETTFVVPTGQVSFGPDLDVLADAMDSAGAPYERVGPGELSRRFPALSVPGPALIEPDSGVIVADRYLAALRRAAGVEVWERAPVLRLEDDGRRVRVVLAVDGGRPGPGELRASGVIVCAGPATAPLLSGLGPALRPDPTFEQVLYLAPGAGADAGSVDAVPVFVERRRPWFYGLPVRSAGVVKISLHGAGPAVSVDAWEEVVADSSSLDRPDPALVAELVDCARRVLPGFISEPVGGERCVYDNSPDRDFVLDRVGNVVVGAGTSGHGFKFAPLLGEMLADLATGVPHHGELGSAADLGRFASSRRP